MMLKNYECFFKTPKENHYFFGYFNKPQVSGDETKLLAMRCKNIDKLPEGNDVAEVGWFDLKKNDGVFHKVGHTSAFNWQQGSMLQFLGPCFNDRIIWNTFENGEYKSKIFSLSKKTTLIFPAIYDVKNDGSGATTIDFERHTWCRRGYSYGNKYNELKKCNQVPGDGIWYIDFASGSKKLIISLDKLIRKSYLNSMNHATHYVEHMLYNPNDQFFTFVHRWRHTNGIHSRLYVCESNGSHLKILNDSGRMSHYCWANNTEILGYGALPNSLNRLRKNQTAIKTVFKILLPVYKKIFHDTSKIAKRLTGDSYLILNVLDEKKHRKILPKLRAHDGHPTMAPKGQIFFTDTYARSVIGEKPKILYVDLKSGNFEIIDELNSIDQYDETPLRCDLHPRLSKSTNILTIDTMDLGVRSIYAYRAVK